MYSQHQDTDCMYVYRNGQFVELTDETADTTGVWIYK